MAPLKADNAEEKGRDTKKANFSGKRLILIGRSMAGKTTLCQYIYEEDIKYNKTQTVEVINGQVIDTPGEYLEQTYMRGALKVSAADADVICFIQQADDRGTMFPPAFSSSFPKPCIGIVTKADLATPEMIDTAKGYLRLAGAREIFVTSSYEGTGFDELLHHLANLS